MATDNERKTLEKGLSAFGGGLNFIDAGKRSSDRLNAHRRKIVEIREDAEYEEDGIRRDAAREEGEARARAGASGVKTSSFDDAFLSEALEAEREAAMIRHRARRGISDAYDGIREERRKKRSASRKLFLDGIGGIIGML